MALVLIPKVKLVMFFNEDELKNTDI